MLLPKIHITIERWKFNKNYNIYVSNLGKLKDINKKDIKPKLNASGYLFIEICNNKQGKNKTLWVHRIVAETWLYRKDMWKEKLTVDHLDHNKRNNTVKNLEWVTADENRKRANADHVFTDTDREIQKMKDIIKNLTLELNNFKSNEPIRIIVNGWTFHSWSEVKSYLIGLNKAYIHTSKTTMEKNVRKAAKNGNLYCGLKWKII